MPSRSATSPIFPMGVRRSISAMTYRAISFVKAREQPPPTLMVKEPEAMPEMFIRCEARDGNLPCDPCGSGVTQRAARGRLRGRLTADKSA